MSFSIWWKEAGMLARHDRAMEAARRESGHSAWLRSGRRRLSRVGPLSRVTALAFAFVLLIVCCVYPLVVEPEKSMIWHLGQISLFAVILVWMVPHGSALRAAYDFDRLHAPSMASLVLFRWRRFLPDYLFIGLCWAGIVWVSLPSGSLSGRDWVFLAAVVVAPVFLRTWWLAVDVVTDRTPAWATVVVGLLAFVPSWLLAYAWSIWHPDETSPVLSAALLGFFVVATPLALWLALRGVAALPASHRRDGDETRIELRGDAGPMPTEHSGRRGLVGNLWWMLRRQQQLVWKNTRRHPTLLFAQLGPVFFYGLSVWLAVASIWNADTTVRVVLPILAALLSVSALNCDDDEQLYMLGVDLGELRRHNLVVRLFGCAVPAVLAALIAMFVMGISPERQATLAVLVGAFALRLGWRGLWSESSLLLAGVVFTVVFVVVPALLITLANVYWFVVAAVLVGVTGVVRLLRQDEAQLRLEMRA